MKTYVGQIDPDTGERTVRVVSVEAGEPGTRTPLWEYELANAAPEKSREFAWGYDGSGPAALAKSILQDHLGREPEPWLFQDFKQQQLGTLPEGSDFTITDTVVAEWLAARDREAKRLRARERATDRARGYLL